MNFVHIRSVQSMAYDKNPELLKAKLSDFGISLDQDADSIVT